MIMDECPKKTEDYNLIKDSMNLSLIGQKDQKKHLKKSTQSHFWNYTRWFI